MPKIARCARMTSEIGRAAVSVHGWPQRPLPRALSLKPVLVGRCSALVRYLLWDVSKRARKKSTTRADARAARVRCLCRVPARRVCLLLCILHIADPEHRVCPVLLRVTRFSYQLRFCLSKESSKNLENTRNKVLLRCYLTCVHKSTIEHKRSGF